MHYQAILPVHYDRVTRFVRQARYAHRHLDWYGLQGWLTHQPFWGSFGDTGELQAVLAVLSEVPAVAWWRVAAANREVHYKRELPNLWQRIRPELRTQGVQRVAVLDLEAWMTDLLATLGFAHSHDVVVLHHRGLPDLPAQSVLPEVRIIPMQPEHIEAVARLDQAVFEPPWQHSAQTLQLALQHAYYATVIVQPNGDVVGYQMSFSKPANRYAHIARLGIAHSHQRQGLGRALAVDAMHHCYNSGLERVGLNTQSNNAQSLALYHRIGFFETGEVMRVWETWV